MKTSRIPHVIAGNGYRDNGPCDEELDPCPEHSSEDLLAKLRAVVEGQPGAEMTEDEKASLAIKARNRLPVRYNDRETSQQVVYYVRFGDRVKIGTTGDFAQRITQLPCDAVLALEPGGYELERVRHRQFTDLHVTCEWFRYEEPLLSHIAGLR
jgi:hypothetical protein